MEFQELMPAIVELQRLGAETESISFGKPSAGRIHRRVRRERRDEKWLAHSN